MKATQAHSINICRPGYGASCALCCGSHNYRAGRAEIDEIFRKRSAREGDFSREYILRRTRGSRSNLTGSYYFPASLLPDIDYPKIHDSGQQCPFVGYLEDGVSIGCLLKPADADNDSAFDCHRAYRSKVFSCAAREMLTDEEVLFAARITGDWYYYSLLIWSGELLRELMRSGVTTETLDQERRVRMQIQLEHSRERDPRLHAPGLYFS